MAGEAGEEVVATGVGNRDVGLAEDYAVALYNLDVGEIDDERAVNAHKTISWEKLFYLFHAYE